MPLQWNQLSSDHFTACLQYTPTHPHFYFVWVSATNSRLLLYAFSLWLVFLAMKQFEGDILKQAILKQLWTEM